MKETKPFNGGSASFYRGSPAAIRQLTKYEQVNSRLKGVTYSANATEKDETAAIHSMNPLY